MSQEVKQRRKGKSETGIDTHVFWFRIVLPLARLGAVITRPLHFTTTIDRKYIRIYI